MVKKTSFSIFERWESLISSYSSKTKVVKQVFLNTILSSIFFKTPSN